MVVVTGAAGRMGRQVFQSKTISSAAARALREGVRRASITSEQGLPGRNTLNRSEFVGYPAKMAELLMQLLYVLESLHMIVTLLQLNRCANKADQADKSRVGIVKITPAMTAQHDIGVLQAFRRREIRDQNDLQTQLPSVFQFEFELFGPSP